MLQRPFEAFEHEPANLPLIVVDIGYSSRQKSCGLAWTGKPSGDNFEFGKAVEKIRQLLDHLANPVLVIEAALSTFHQQNGNPGCRGDFEKDRGWYWGSGAVSLLAAQRLLRQLTKGPDLKRPVWLAEAFLSNKIQKTGHKSDAGLILRQFWCTRPKTALNLHPI